MKLLMVAAENGALPGGKVGGMGDVLRDAPAALASRGHEVVVLTPGYQKFSRLPGAVRVAEVTLPFRGRLERVELFRLPQRKTASDTQGWVQDWVLEHPLFGAAGPGRIYSDDPPERPFATDASRFALFCSAVVQALVSQRLPQPDIIHLHDWHTAMVALLARHDLSAAALKHVPLVYTIHNLALQGIRPFGGDESSLESWFPGLQAPRKEVADPRYPDCFNAMRTGINLCGKVHAVSPTYAREILEPGDKGEGGAGLELDLQRAQREGRLVGITNGCEYPPRKDAPPFAEWLGRARHDIERWVGNSETVLPTHLLALRRLDALLAGGARRPARLLTSVGRLTGQKLGILLQTMDDGREALDHLLDLLGEDGLLIMVGSGDPLMQKSLTHMMAERHNFIFLQGFSETLSESLYEGGDLFLMPSSFEPCGISQMLAMRAGQPCLVHAVGGLADTVEDGKTGFSFRGANRQEQALAMLERLQDALATMEDKKEWNAMRQRAAAARFPWDEVASEYERSLYKR